MCSCPSFAPIETCVPRARRTHPLSLLLQVGQERPLFLPYRKMLCPSFSSIERCYAPFSPLWKDVCSVPSRSSPAGVPRNTFAPCPIPRNTCATCPLSLSCRCLPHLAWRTGGIWLHPSPLSLSLPPSLALLPLPPSPSLSLPLPPPDARHGEQARPGLQGPARGPSVRILVNDWSNSGQTWSKQWSNCGSKSLRGSAPGPAVRMEGGDGGGGDTGAKSWYGLGSIIH